MASINIKSLISQLNNYCTTILESAAGLCVSRSHYEITVEHVIWQMIENPASDFSLIAKYYGITHEEMKSALSKILEEFPTGNTAKPVFSPRLVEWYKEALLEGTTELNESGIRSGTLFLSFLTKADRLSCPELTDILTRADHGDLKINFYDIIKTSVEQSMADKKADPGRSGEQSAIQKYCEDFTNKADQGDIDPVFGRDTEIRQVIDIFARRRKNNPIVVGEAGVGKTAIVEGLALRIVKKDVPDFLKDVRLISLDMGLLQAGASVKGEFENRLKNVIKEVKASERPIILFIDEAHTMIGAGGAAGGSDAANLLKPALARGELRTVAATTWSEYKKYFEKDAALARRFQAVYLDEPSEETATLILRGLKQKYEQAHGVIIRDDAIVAASSMSARYISGRYLPDKAIDLLDTSCARVKVLLTSKPAAVENLERKLNALNREHKALMRDKIYDVKVEQKRVKALEKEIKSLEKELGQTKKKWKNEQALAAELIELKQKYYNAFLSEDKPGPDLKTKLDAKKDKLAKIQDKEIFVKTEVDPEIVSEVIADWTGIPVGKVQNDDAGKVINMAANLEKRIKGQTKAIEEIARIIKSSKTGLKDPDQPNGVFFLVGPSGVGKTETGLAIADLLFGGEDSSVSVNMSEFQEKHTVSRLIGSPPGYVGYGEGGVLTEAIRKRPYSAVLLDEAEKANPEVMNLFYQVFDKGVLADGEGRNINFKNTIILLTSNLASDIITQMAKDPDITSEQIIKTIRPVLSEHFKPALLARMTIIPYLPLKPDIMKEIVKLKIDKLEQRLSQTHNIKLTYTPKLIDQIALRCLEVETGARNIDHIMEGTILPLLSQKLLTLLSTGKKVKQIKISILKDNSFAIN